MNSRENQEKIWSQLDELPSEEIIRLVEMTVTVLQPGWDEARDINKMPPGPLTRMLKETLAERQVQVSDDQLKLLIDENETSLNISRELLREIATVPDLAAEVEKAYYVQKRMMVIEPVSWLLAGAVLVLAIKVKEIDLEKGKVKFHKLSDKTIDSLCGLLGIGKGIE